VVAAATVTGSALQYWFQALHGANAGIRNMLLGECARRAMSNRTGRANNAISQP
jgi:hypothetical protein